MNKFYRRLKKYTRISLQILLFLFAAVALYFILPGEPRFKYEYQKGFPWKHENLVAPFDFTILKTAKELDDEKQEHIKQILPYFTCDTSIATRQVMQLKNDLQLSSTNISPQKQALIDTLTNELNKIYQTGILQFSVESYKELQGKTSIRKRVGNTIRRIDTNLLYSEKTAYNAINELQHSLTTSGISVDWLKSHPLEHYISANLIYDAETTQKEIDEMTKISPYREEWYDWENELFWKAKLLMPKNIRFWNR